MICYSDMLCIMTCCARLDGMPHCVAQALPLMVIPQQPYFLITDKRREIIAPSCSLHSNTSNAFIFLSMIDLPTTVDKLPNDDQAGIRKPVCFPHFTTQGVRF